MTFDIRSLIQGIKTDWKDILITILNENKDIENNINNLLQFDLSKDKKIFPPVKDIFFAFQFFNFKDLKCIILGQDVYHSEGQAHGLAFSVRQECKIPPSLRNIFKELKREFGQDRKNPDLTDWAEQGVLMINTAFTVIENQPESHIHIWKPFTDEILGYIGRECEGVIGMLWGNYAKKYLKILNPDKNFLLTFTHPSPLSRKPFECGHFKRCNEILQENKKNEIKWV